MRDQVTSPIVPPRWPVVSFCAAALFSPWNLGARARTLPDRWAAIVGASSVLVAAALSTVLSSWTYLAGKGLLLGRTEMDMGQDDLPPDTLKQVALGFAGSFVMWSALLVLVLVLCAIVADTVYRDDRTAVKRALRCAGGTSVWLVVWALAVLASNSVRHHEVRHPEAAVRAYAQIRQQGFAGSSALSPGPPLTEPLAGHRRLTTLVVLFPLLWSIGLPAPESSRGRSRRWGIAAAALSLWWLAWITCTRLLPWVTIDGFLG
jgi:hypothetical protein